jgi:hypothetical protein
VPLAFWGADLLVECAVSFATKRSYKPYPALEKSFEDLYGRLKAKEAKPTFSPSNGLFMLQDVMCELYEDVCNQGWALLSQAREHDFEYQIKWLFRNRPDPSRDQIDAVKACFEISHFDVAMAVARGDSKANAMDRARTRYLAVDSMGLVCVDYWKMTWAKRT